MHFRSGPAFEQAIFGCHSTGILNNGVKRNFSRDMKRFVKSSRHDSLYPNTWFGENLYFGVKSALDRVGIDTRGFFFRSSLDSRVDISHGADGIFYLPSLPEIPVTIDLFNIDSLSCSILRERWSGLGSYSEYDFQKDLFFQKWGMKRHHKSESGLDTIEWTKIFNPPDYRKYCSRPRNENHFVLTPYYLVSRENRHKFTHLVADYFVGEVRKM